MATIHLTPEEKRAMAADKERRAKLYKAKTLRNKQIKNLLIQMSTFRLEVGLVRATNEGAFLVFDAQPF